MLKSRGRPGDVMSPILSSIKSMHEELRHVPGVASLNGISSYIGVEFAILYDGKDPRVSGSRYCQGFRGQANPLHNVADIVSEVLVPNTFRRNLTIEKRLSDYTDYIGI